MNSKDKVELAELRLESGRITQEEFDEVMTEVMWTQVEIEDQLLYDLHDGGTFHKTPSEELLATIKDEIIRSTGYWMEQSDMDKYDHNIYMVSEDSMWYCYMKEPNLYWLFNGEWGAYVQGTDTEICWKGIGSPENEHVEVTDWRRVSGSWMAKECSYFYRPRPKKEVDWSDFDDDIAF